MATITFMYHRSLALYKDSFSGLSKEVWLVSLVTFINRSGTMVIPFLGVYMTSRLGFSLEEAGWVLLCFGLGSLSGSYVGGYLTDRIGYYQVQFWSLFAGGVCFILLGFFETFWGVCLMIFLVSTIGDAFRPAVMTAIAVYSKPANRTRAFSLMRMAINFGWAMGPAIGGWLVSFQGYEALFWVDGLTCMAAALVFRFTLRPKEVTEKKKVKTPEEQAAMPLRDHRYLFFLLLTLIGAIVFMQFLYTLPIFYKEEMLFPEGMIGGLLALNGLLIAFTEMPLVYILEKRGKVIDNIWIGILMFGLAFLILNLASGPSLFIAIFSMIVLSVGEIFNMPFGNTYAMSRASEGNMGAYMGLYSMTYSVSHIIGPPLGTQTAAHFGFDALWYLMGILSMLSVMGYLYLKKMEKRDTVFPLVTPEGSPRMAE